MSGISRATIDFDTIDFDTIDFDTIDFDTIDFAPINWVDLTDGNENFTTIRSKSVFGRSSRP
jgi:hypothetical protein